MVKLLTDFPEAKYLAAVIGSGVYQALLSGRGLSSMVMGVRSKDELPKSSQKRLLNQS